MKIISLKLLKLSFRCCETYISNSLLRQLMCGHLMNIWRIGCQIELYWCCYNALWIWEGGSLTRSKQLPCGHLMDISTINKMKAVQLNYWHYDNALWKQGTGLLIRSKPLSFSHLMDIWRELLGPNQKFQKNFATQLYRWYGNALWKRGGGSLTRSKQLTCGHLMDIWRLMHCWKEVFPFPPTSCR